MVKFLSIFFATLFSFSFLTALNPQKAVSQYNLDIWQAERGLAQGLIQTIRQTRDGYLWLGTLQGLVRFDGIRFEVFHKDNTPHLLDNVITVLFEDADGVLWIGTAEGGLTVLKDGKLSNYPVHLYPGLKNIVSIFQSRDKALWFGTNFNGLTKLKNGSFTRFTVEHGVPVSKIRAFYQDKEDRLHIATSSGLLMQSSPGRFTPYSRATAPFNKYMTSLCIRKNRELWFGCGDGLYCIKNNRITHYGKDEGLPHQVIKFVYEDKDQNLWAGTDGGGLVRVKNGKIEIFSTNLGLASDYLKTIYQCKEGNLWLGTSEGGLHRLQDSFVTNYTTMEGLNNNKVTSIMEDRIGGLWVGTRGGAHRLQNGTFTLSLSRSNGLLSNTIYSTLEDSQGNIWLATRRGLNRFKQGKITSFTTNDGLSHNHILNLMEDNNGTIWINTVNLTHHFHNGKLSQFHLEGENSGVRIKLMYKDPDGSLWLALDNGNFLSWKDGKITFLISKHKLVSGRFESICVDSDGTLYIGTRDGLTRVAQGKITNFTTQNGLLDSNVREILEDRKGFMWLAGRTGISYLHKIQLQDFAEGKIKRINPHLFDVSDGLISPWYEKGIKASDGKLWFTSAKGLSMIDPDNIETKRLPFPVIIEKLIVDEKEVDIPHQQPLTLTPGKKRLEFHYTAPSFIKTQKMRFKLKLDGYDARWLDKGNERTTTYTGLSPGNYTLYVKACSGDGIWSPNAASLSFTIQPYFYQTTWFYVSVALFLLGASFSLYRFRIMQLKKRENELSAQVRSRTRQLAEQSEQLKEMDKVKSRFFANISHEFRTPLTLIMGPLEEKLAGSSHDKKQQTEFKMMLRNSRRLLNLVNQLLDLSRFDSGKMELQATAQDIVPFFKAIVNAFDSLAVQNGLTLKVHAPDRELILLYDAEKLEHAILNLMINAVKYTPSGGEISAGLKQIEGHRVELSVRDTGIGIAPGQSDHIFERFYQAEGPNQPENKGSGIGLALTKEIVKLHNGEITVHSELGKGSEFIISLPGPGVPADYKSAVQTEIESVVSTGVRDMLDTMAPQEEEDEVDELSKSKDSDAGKNIILLVEDNADVRAYIRKPLQSLYRVEEAVNGSEGIQKAQEIIPDLIISDIMMPGTDGYELCKVLKNDVRTSHIPIILLTAKASEESIVEGFETRADDYVTKPFNTKILIARIDSLIDTRRRLQERYRRERMLEPSEIQVSSVDREFMKDLQKAVEANLSDPDFSINRLADLLYMSRATLNRKIRALTGESANRYIQVYRLKRGAQLLKGNFGNVTQVAFEVGFSSSPYFAKCFREIFHQSPQSYQAAESPGPAVRADN